jgi:hypothetical protein
MARALNKNKKPETNNKNRACNYFLGSFGSPCGFCGEGACPRWVAKQPQALEHFRNHASATHWNGGKPPRHSTQLGSCYKPCQTSPFKRLRSFLHHPPTKC